MGVWNKFLGMLEVITWWGIVELFCCWCWLVDTAADSFVVHYWLFDRIFLRDT